MTAHEPPPTASSPVPRHPLAQDDPTPSNLPDEDAGSGEGALSALEHFKRRQQARGLVEPKGDAD